MLLNKAAALSHYLNMYCHSSQVFSLLSQTLKLDLVDIAYEQNKDDNLTRAERKALTTLKARDDIVINKADKGSTIVIQDVENYISDGLTHLTNPAVYRHLQKDSTPEIKKDICLMLEHLHRSGMLSRDMLVFCMPPRNHRTSQLYFLKKIHKNPMGIRSIVSSVNSVTENISQFVDIWLQPIMKSLPSFIKDTTDFINLIEATTLASECVLASIDVSSLYTNIPHIEGREAAVTALSLMADPDPCQPPPTIMGLLIDVVLQNNVFEFNDNFYLQLQGTAMETKMAPAYANIFMGNLEKQLLNRGKDKILLWRRFIDDIFVIWNGSEAEFKQYMEDINTLHRTIKFTHECSNQEIVFLDVTVYKGPRFLQEGILDVKTHIKPTNKQLYVHSTSYHPPKTGKSIMLGEANRYLRTNSNEENFQESIHRLSNKLKQRGYNPSQISKYTSSIKFSDRTDKLRGPPKKTMDRPLVFATTYCDRIPEIRMTLQENWTEMHQTPRLKEIFPKTPMIAFKKNRSLSNTLVRAKLSHHSDSSLPTDSRTRGSSLPTQSQIKTLMMSEHHYTGKKPPTFKELNSFPFKLFPKKKVVKPCCRRICNMCKRINHTSNFVKSKVNGRCFPIVTKGPAKAIGLYT